MLAVLRSSVSLTCERVGYSDPGMTRLKAEIGLPFKAHAGTWSNGRGNDTKNPYYTVPEYKFVVEGGGAVPQGPGLWDHVFSYARSAFSVPLTVWLTVARFRCLAAAKTASRSTSKLSSRTVSATHICPCSHPFLWRRTPCSLSDLLPPDMCEEIGMRSMSSTVNVARDWLGGMGQGAENQNFSIQCEQTTPRISDVSERPGV